MVRSREYILIGIFIVFLSLTPDSFAAGFTSGNGEVRIQKCHFRDGNMQVSDDPILLIPQVRPNSCGCMHAIINHPVRLRRWLHGDGHAYVRYKSFNVGQQCTCTYIQSILLPTPVMPE